MDRFVERQNIEHYQAMLKISTDPERRQVLEKLLVDAQAKFKEDEAAHNHKSLPWLRPMSHLSETDLVGASQPSDPMASCGSFDAAGGDFCYYPVAIIDFLSSTKWPSGRYIAQRAWTNLK